MVKSNGLPVKKLSLLLLVILLPLVLQAKEREPYKVYVDGRLLEVLPFVRKGVLYLPVEPLAAALKIKIRWNPNNEEILVNKKPIRTGSLIREGALYVPVEAVARGSGVQVEWDGATRAIRIETKPLVAKAPSPEEESSEETSEEMIPTPPPPSKSPPKEVLFIPKTTANGDFSVTVTNVEETHLLKNYYKPKEGKKFVVVHVSEQNISDKVQMYTGRFALQDQNQISFDYIDGLSNFYLQILRPGGINFGSLVFEVPEDSAPARLLLHTYENPPLTVSLYP